MPAGAWVWKLTSCRAEIGTVDSSRIRTTWSSSSRNARSPETSDQMPTATAANQPSSSNPTPIDRAAVEDVADRQTRHQRRHRPGPRLGEGQPGHRLGTGRPAAPEPPARGRLLVPPAAIGPAEDDQQQDRGDHPGRQQQRRRDQRGGPQHDESDLQADQMDHRGRAGIAAHPPGVKLRSRRHRRHPRTSCLHSLLLAIRAAPPV
jgi:hypothetical protein